MQRSVEEIEEEAQRLAGCQFNLGSSAEVSNILFNVLKLAVPPNAKPLRVASFTVLELRCVLFWVRLLLMFVMHACEWVSV